jgi:hypothetical protein
LANQCLNPCLQLRFVGRIEGQLIKFDERIHGPYYT